MEFLGLKKSGVGVFLPPYWPTLGPISLSKISCRHAAEFCGIRETHLSRLTCIGPTILFPVGLQQKQELSNMMYLFTLCEILNSSEKRPSIRVSFRQRRLELNVKG